MRLFFLLALVGAVLGTLVLIPASIQAAGDEIEVLNQRAESQFPDGVRFFIEAESPDEIDDIRVFFKKIGQTNRSSYRAVEFESGNVINGESLIRSGTGGEYIPPGTRIEYFFEIRDTGGRVLRTEEEIIVYLDNRLDWQTVTDGLITVYYDGEDGGQRAQVVLASAQKSLDRMGPVLGIEPTNPLHIVTYSDYRDMSLALPFRARAVEEQLITQGMAFGDERVLLVNGSNASVANTTTHEFTHLLVSDAVGRLISKVPAWLNEGLAEFSTGEPDASFRRALENAIDRETVRPLWHQQTFSGTPGEIILAYGQGVSVVTYLIDTYGDDKVAEMLQALKKTLNIDKAMEQTYGFDQYGLDTEWRISLGMEPLPPPRKAQPRVLQQPTATPQPLPDPTTAPDPTAAAPPAPIPAPAGAIGGPDTPSASPGCNAPVHGGPLVMDLATLMLLGGPLAMLSFRAFRRRKVF